MTDAALITISELPITNRARNALAVANIRTVADLLHYTPTQLLAGVSEFGNTSLKSVEEAIEARGFHLKTETSRPMRVSRADHLIKHTADLAEDLRALREKNADLEEDNKRLLRALEVSRQQIATLTTTIKNNQKERA